VNAGGGMNFITGGAGNDTFYLPTAGSGLDTISNFSLTNGDVLNLTAALTASGWNFQASSLGNYLKVSEVGNNAMIGIAVGGNTTNIAELVGANLTLTKLLPHIVT
jgi:Ca2+-binding RTX toxin-like protein